jgi:hypothetical protein
VGHLGFHDLDKRLEAISAKGDPLEALNGLIPFESFRAEIEAVVRLAPEERKSKAGRKAFDAVMMFKVLVLQTPLSLRPSSTTPAKRTRRSKRARRRKGGRRTRPRTRRRIRCRSFDLI